MSTKQHLPLNVHGVQIEITNPNKPLWPEPTITKADFLQKLIILSPYLLPYCKDRYLTTIRWPHGIQDEFFYQKNAPKPVPQYVSTAELGGIHYVNLNSLPTLLWLGNLACLEFHPSFHLIGQETPAEWIIDIDPSQDYEPRLAEATTIVGNTLRELGIESIPKTSGATGIQLFIPIERRYTFAQLRALGEFVSHFLVQKHANLFTIERLKKDRGQKIYLDYLQHWPGKTLSAPYTTRARTHAPVSTPLEWHELQSDHFDPSEYNLFTIEQRLEQKGDLLAQAPKQSLDDILTWLEQRRK